MAKTLREQMESDRADVFLNVDEFAETITHWKAGNSGDTEQIVAVVDRDDELHSGTGPGDGRRIDTHTSLAIRGLVRIEMSIDVDVSEPRANGESASIFVLADGTRVKVVRIAAEDDAMQTVDCLDLRRVAQRKGDVY